MTFFSWDICSPYSGLLHSVCQGHMDETELKRTGGKAEWEEEAGAKQEELKKG